MLLTNDPDFRLTRVRRNIIAAKTEAWRNRPVRTTLPTVTTAFDGTLTTYSTFAASGNSFANVFGGTLSLYFTYYISRPDQINSPGFGQTQYEFFTDAPKVQFLMFQGTCHISVDGQSINKSGIATSVGGGLQVIALDWGGVRTPRLYSMVCHESQPIHQIGVDSLSRVWKPSADDAVRCFVDGDSYAYGTGASPGFDALSMVCRDYLGIRDLWKGPVGGTGWLNAGGAQTVRSRLSNITASNPDFVIVAAGYNDTVTGIQTEVQTYITAFRAALPRVPLVITGVWPGATGPGASVLAVEAAISAAVTAANDSLVKFVPIANDTAGAWTFGTGSNGGGSGNGALYIGADAVHPNPAGHLYLGKRLADGIGNALFAMSP